MCVVCSCLLFAFWCLLFVDCFCRRSCLFFRVSFPVFRIPVFVFRVWSFGGWCLVSGVWRFDVCCLLIVVCCFLRLLFSVLFVGG